MQERIIYHAWNKVRIGDNWYNIDACWSDGGNQSKWFMQSDNTYVSNGHIAENGKFTGNSMISHEDYKVSQNKNSKIMINNDI